MMSSRTGTTMGDRARTPARVASSTLLLLATLVADGKPAKPSDPVAPLDPGFVSFETVGHEGPTTIVRQILQDADGELWFATFGGVYRWDGKLFVNLTDIADLQATRAFSLLRDRDDRIWIGTMGAGVYRWDGRDFDNVSSRDGLAGDHVLAMFQDRDGAVWFGFEGAGASRFDGKTFTSFGAADGFTDGDVSSIAQGPDGRMWFGSREGLFSWDGETFTNLSTRHGLETGGYVPTLVDRRGRLWFGGVNGLHVLDGEALLQLSSEESWALLDTESDGRIWFAASGTIFTLSPGTELDGIEKTLVEVAVYEGMCFDLYEDRERQVWVATLDGVRRIEDGRLVRASSGGTRDD